jgi:hypothetical protein
VTYCPDAMSRTFQFAVVLALLLIALAAFRFSENGRYQYFPETERTPEVVLDTRTGESWQITGGGIADADPHSATLTIHLVHVRDLTSLETCLDGKSRSWLLHPLAMRYCRQDHTGEKIDFQPENASASH